MNQLLGQINIQVNPKIYLKEPNSSDLGKRIISESIILIEEKGMEAFTFGKLAKQLKTAESSIYRYFENKHKLLLYLIAWHWGWLEYQLVFKTTNVACAKEKLTSAIKLFAQDIPKNEIYGNINLELLNRIIVSESSKAYLTKEVDEANKEGFYLGYKKLVNRVCVFIKEINPKFEFEHTLVSTIFEGIHHQKYFANYLPSLTDITNDSKKLANFYTDMALAIITKEN